MSLSHLDKVLTDIGPWFRSTLKTLPSSILDIVKKYIFDFYGLMVTLILLAIFLVLMETIRDRGVMLEPILVSQKIADMGYTPDIVARRLKDSANVYHVDEVIKIKETILSYRYHELDVVLPEVGISIKSVSNYFRDLLRRNLTNISGEMLYHEAQEQISFRLRLNSEQIFNEFESFSEEGIILLIKDAGYALTKRVNPFALAIYHYKNDKEPENARTTAQKIANYIINNLDKDEYDYARAVNLKGVLHHNDGEYEEAIKHYKWAIDLDSSFVAPYTNWAEVLAKKGDYHGAIKKIKKANKIDPDNVNTYVYWCRLLVSKKIPDFEGAIKKCMKALKLNPNNASAHLYWGVVLMHKTTPDWDGAIEKYMEVLKHDPGNITAHINLGFALMNKKNPDWDGAIENYKEALKHDKENAVAYFHWGTALMNKGDWDGAINKYEEALKHDKENAMAYFTWGIALMYKNNWDGAINKYEEALKHEPGYAPAHINWGFALVNKGDWDGAIIKYKEALKHDPGNIEAHINLGIALMRKTNPDWEGAIENYKEALKHDRDNASAYINWGFALMNKQKPDWYGAIDKHKKVIELQPTSYKAYNHIITSLRKVNKSNTANKVQGCMNSLDDRNKSLECSELVLSINTWGIHRIIGQFTN